MRKFLLLLCPLLLTNQSLRDNPDQDNNTLFAKLSLKDVERLYTLQNQLIYYYDDLSKLISKADDESYQTLSNLNNLISNSLEIVNDFEMETDTLFQEGDSLMSFLNEKDILLNGNLRGILKGDHNRYIDSLTIIFNNWKNQSEHERQRLMEEANDGSIEFKNRMEKHHQDFMEKQISYLQSGVKPDDYEYYDVYNNIMMILHFLKPTIAEIISAEDSDTRKVVIENYIQTKAENGLIASLGAFMKSNPGNQLLLMIFENEEKIKKASSLIRKYGEVSQFPIDLQRSTKISTESTEEELKNELEKIEKELDDYKFRQGIYLTGIRDQLLNMIDEILLTILGLDKDNSFDNLREYWEKSTINQYTEKATDYIRSFDINNTNRDYFELKPDLEEPADQRIWLRFRLDEGSMNQLLEDKTINSANAYVSLILVPEKKPLDDINFNESFLKIKQSDIEKAKDAINQMYFEIPLGITIKAINLKVVESSQFQAQYLNEKGAVEDFNVGVELRDIGVWTRIKYNRECVIQACAELGLSRALGIEIQKVELNINTLDLVFHLSWRPIGFLRNIIEDKPGLKNMEISLSEINSLANQSKDIKGAFTRAANKRIAENLTSYLQANKPSLSKYCLAERVLDIKVEDVDQSIQGAMSMIPIGATSMGIIDTVNVQFKIDFKNGNSQLVVSKPRVDISRYLRLYFKESLIGLKELKEIINKFGRHLKKDQYTLVLSNMIQAIQIENFIVDLKKQSIFGFISVPGESPIKLYVTENGVDTGEIESLLKRQAENFIRRELRNLLLDYTSDLTGELLVGIDNICSSWQNLKPKFYGLPLKMASLIDCSDGIVRAKAVYNEGEINLSVDATASASGVKINFDINDQQKLIDALLKDILKEFNNNKHLTFVNPRFSSGLFLVDLEFGLGTLNIYEGIGTIQVSSQGKLSFQGKSSVFLRNQLYSMIDTELKTALDDFISENDPYLEFGQEGEGIRIVEGTVVSLKPGKITFNAEAVLPFGIVVRDISVIFTFDTVVPRIELPDLNWESLVLGGIKLDFAEDLTVEIDIEEVEKSPIALIGTIKITIADLFPLPAIRFRISQSGHSFNLRPKVTLPFVVEIAPLIAAVKPGIELITEEKIARIETNLTLGITEEAHLTQNLIKVKAKMDFNYSKIGEIDYNGTAYLINFLPVLKGDGALSLRNSNFYMQERTTGFLRKVLKYDRRIDIDGGERMMKGESRMEMLGFSAQVNSSATAVGNTAVEVYGSGQYSFLGQKLGIGIGTRLTPLQTLDLYRYAYANLNGSMNIGEFNLAGVHLNANIFRAKMKFEVLSVELGLTAPLASSITEGDILKLIMSIFDFDPEALLEILKNPDNINISVGPVGVGDGDNSLDNPNNHPKNNNPASPGKGSDPQQVPKSTEYFSGQGPIPPFDDEDFQENRPVEPVSPIQTAITPFNFSVKKFDEFSNASKAREFWPCLPSDWMKGSLVIRSEKQSGKFIGYDYVPQGIGGPGGMLIGKNYFVVRISIPIFPLRKVGERTYLCLTEEGYPASKPLEFCVEVDEYLKFNDFSPGYYANLAYSDDDIYLFLSHNLGDSWSNYCTDRSTMTYEHLEFNHLDEQIEQESYQIDCNRCQVLDLKYPNNLRRQFTILRNGNSLIQGYRYQKGLLGFGNRANRFRPINQAPDFMTFANSIDPDFNNNQLKLLIDNLDLGNNDYLIISGNKLVLVNERSELYVNKPGSNTLNTSEIIRQYNLLPARTWEKLSSNNFKNLFRQLSWYSSDMTVTQLMNTLKGENLSDLRKVQHNVEEYLRRWIRFGGEPNFQYVTTYQPRYEFKIWDYNVGNQLDGWRSTYTYEKGNSPKPFIPENLVYDLERSDVTDYFNMTGAIALKQKNFIESSTGHLFKNYLLYTMTQAHSNKVLFAVSKKGILYADRNSSEFKFTAIKNGAYDPKVREKEQLFFHDGLELFLSDNDHLFIPNLLRSENYKSFFMEISDRIIDDSTVVIHVGRFTQDEQQILKGFMLTQDNVYLFWTVGDGHRQLSITRSKFEDNIKTIMKTYGNYGYYSRRVKKNITLNQLENDEALVSMIFNGFNDFIDWNEGGTVDVHPFILFNNTRIK
ncbi:hypothetical protein QQ020_23300 [Fulvivirgaceae bacterium BMA12]|uniref:Uncharacterized protein n=1 Tax=Agaribacillus aureus TaxID=3051825 RepID=A0ABT8LDI4_9BACT|nr:hypothetical protein [Fulvivirgaceae bacterium BMA12]